MLDAQALTEKINALPAEQIAEVEDFVEAAAPAFAAIWDNSADDVYDAL